MVTLSHLGKCSLLFSARFFPVTVPSLTLSDCKKMANMLDMRMTKRRAKRNDAPAATSVA